MSHPAEPPRDRDEATQQPERLDLTQLAELLRDRRGNLSIRQAAQEAGVSFSTLSRVEAGAHPDLATFTRLCAWLGVSPSRFFTPVVEREITPLDEAITHLRADPRLTADAAAKISSVLKDLYGALARDIAPPKSIVACHLRADPVMRPGVAPRLASLLQDMHEALERKVEAGEL
ncbi:helix-turn-helix domain-containing protein [Lentzea sp. NBRC 105346]|uniref:helix-turn-helix domain-containing protein n=1 Tax=Lentzea sp. NBRC 105346 TaxID=3032205 RepID=UPI002552D3F8|nr:helix-turn-helix domain-containing protein [Lentzea sp. NBRC 105346]